MDIEINGLMARIQTGGHGAAEAYLANLGDDNLILTALLPSDATTQRNLVLGILDKDDLSRQDSALPRQDLSRERILAPGEVAQFSLRQAPARTHTSLFRVRKQRDAASAFLSYVVERDGAGGTATLTPLGTPTGSWMLENTFPHLLYVR